MTSGNNENRKAVKLGPKQALLRMDQQTDVLRRYSYFSDFIRLFHHSVYVEAINYCKIREVNNKNAIQESSSDSDVIERNGV